MDVWSQGLTEVGCNPGQGTGDLLDLVSWATLFRALTRAALTIVTSKA